MSKDKFYVIVRKDLPSKGAIVAQSCHSVAGFSRYHPSLLQSWHDTSNYIVILEVKNQEELLSLQLKAMMEEIPNHLFREPDWNDDATALALAAGEKSSQMVRHLKLALQD
jgi:peptidyl-tRNA hydrolase